MRFKSPPPPSQADLMTIPAILFAVSSTTLRARGSSVCPGRARNRNRNLPKRILDICMNKPDFATMTRPEFRQYILEHREDEEAVSIYLELLIEALKRATTGLKLKSNLI